MGAPKIPIDPVRLELFCRKHFIRKLSLFGSVLRSDFRAESDVDVLVEFEAGHVPGLLGFVAMQEELAGLFGRKVDLNTAGFLGRRFRDRVLAEADVQYDAST